jgi:CheY-like chemotaxis protein
MGDGAAAPTPRRSPDTLLYAGRRILVVEDNAVNQTLAATLLKKMGCDVRIARNGREAIEFALTSAFDLILMDCQMPEMDGFRATGEIRKQEKGDRRVPIIALTAAAFPADREQCRKAGMDDHLAKPLRVTQLESILARFL